MSKIRSTTWDEKSGAIYAQLKIDGAFLRIIKDAENEIRCLSSLDTDLTQQISDCKPRWLLNLYKNMPLSSSVLGELYYHDIENKCGCPASYIKTGLAETINWYNDKNLDVFDGFDRRLLGNTRKNKINHTKQLCFSAFALEKGFDGIDAFSPLEDVQVQVLKLGVTFAPYVNLVRKLSRDFKISKDFLLGPLLQDFAARSKGLAEGVMLKGGNLSRWWKVKKEKTIDCFIVGYLPGKGKYAGKVGSLRCAVYNNAGKAIEIATVGGFNDEIRDWLTDMFSEHKNDVINQVIEVQYQFVATQGRLRHPRFKNWRDDKLSNECLTDQDDELVSFWE